ncbi:MAG: NUDIX hydrolase [Candidatus Micrarchaeaceae archaeon]
MKSVLLRNKIFSVESERFSKGGKILNMFRIRLPNVAVILPILSNGRILMERQYRFPIKKYIYELPAGDIKKGERPEDAAMRELEEETGYIAGKLRFMFRAYASPGISTETFNMYVATGLKKTKQRLDYSEFISLREVSISDALSMIEKGRIADSKTIACIMYYLQVK